jgi:sialidase-1
MRRSDHNNQKSYCRKVAWSKDGGDTFGPTKLDHDLIGSICQASVLSVIRDKQPSLLLQSNPKSVRRERMTVRGSLDGGESWSDGVCIYAGSSAYSDLVQVDEQTIGLLFERILYGKITFVRFKPEAVLVNGRIACFYVAGKESLY